MSVSERNPYVFEQPIEEPSDFVGREGILEACWTVLRRPNHAKLSLVGGPGSGKTSVLRQLLNPAQQQQRLSPNSPSPLLYVDCRAIMDAEDFLCQVSRTLITKLPSDLAKEYCEPVTDDSTLSYLLEDLPRLPALLVDHICSLINNQTVLAEVSRILRGWIQDIGVPTIIASSKPLRLCVPAREAGSSLAGIFDNDEIKELGPFTAEEVRKLVTMRDARSSVVLAPYLDHIQVVGGRIPLFVQLACASYYELLKGKSSLTDEDHRAALRRFSQVAEAHFRRIWDSFSEEEQALAREAAGDGIIDENDKLAENLRERGYLVENRLFSLAFTEFVLGKI